jgi:hypothetical protein
VQSLQFIIINYSHLVSPSSDAYLHELRMNVGIVRVLSFLVMPANFYVMQFLNRYLGECRVYVS